MIIRRLSIAFAAIALAASTSAQTVTAQRDLTALLEEIRVRFELPALAGVILTSGGPVASGFAGVREAGRPERVTPEDLFHLGSCTKAMTATLAAVFVEQEKISFSTTLEEVFDEYAEGMHVDWRAVTLAQLLSHTAGGPSDLLAFQPLSLAVVRGKDPLPRLRRRVVESVTAVAPAFDPGTDYLYSNWGYVMAAAMLEKFSGKPWEKLIVDHVFKPLEMRSFGFGPPDKPGEHAQPCAHTADGKPAPGFDNPATIGPAGTVHASMSDWAKFVQLHLQGARGVKGLLLEPKTFEVLHTARPGTKGTYGAGWLVLKRPWTKGRVLAHTGSNTAWFTCTWIAPDEDFAVLVACNRGGEAGQQGTDAAAWAMIQEQLKE